MATEEPAEADCMTEQDWRLLLTRIKEGKCTPLLGPDFSPVEAPDHKQFVKDLIESAGLSDFPFGDDQNSLPRVAQIVASNYDDSSWPQDQLQKSLRALKTPDFDSHGEPHRILAELQLPVYVTANQNDFMCEALRHVKKDPQFDWCRWSENSAQPTSDSNSPFVKNPNYIPDPANPLVYHMFGHLSESHSLVVTEDHYLEFLADVCGKDDLLPPRIHRYISGQQSMLFLGFHPHELAFRVLLRSLVSLAEPSVKHVAVQLFAFGDYQAPQRRAVQKYVAWQSGNFDKHIWKLCFYWGNCSDFLLELKRRLEEFHAH